MSKSNLLISFHYKGVDKLTARQYLEVSRRDIRLYLLLCNVWPAGLVVVGLSIQDLQLIKRDYSDLSALGEQSD